MIAGNQIEWGGWLMGFGSGRIRRALDRRARDRRALDRRRWLAAGAVVAVLATAGCAQANPSVVAYVGSTGQITQADLDGAVAGIDKTLQAGQSVSTPAVISAMIQGEIASQVAAEKGITITDAQRDAVIKSSSLAPLLDVPEARRVIYDVADAQLVPKAVGADVYIAAVKQTQVTLNPRFGQLDETDKTVQDPSSGSLSTPAPVPGQ